MKKRILTLIFSLLSLISFSYNYTLHDLAIANKVSQIEKKPLLIYFASPECIYCKKFESEVLSNKVFQTILRGSYVFVKITPDNNITEFFGKEYTNRELFALFGVRGTPTFVFWNNNQVITSVPGYMPEDIFIKALRYILRFIYSNIKISFEEYSKAADEFYGIPKIITVSKDEADFILKNDKNAVFISTLSEKDDKFALYITEDNQIANKLIKSGVIRVLLINNK
ncbi:thioredoxin family protein [Thermosipho ferrireducens]|uniref:Thioredoxin family protein n=1 Tax=Thermosipho ferrireducens TaxID=2571116 RepID=A0ABX7S909_9BACT|nr:thioredoxin family protein [Thermosipho ferrireducens]QTA38729.1 thioredoxin family protein [Thermosipho ferrireducens]